MSEAPASTAPQTRDSLRERFHAVRRLTAQICEPLSAEDCTIQSMPDVSPTRWHLAHTSWFFETFILAQTPGYRPFHPAFERLFNSYYNAVGEQFPRPNRGLLSRPGLDEIWDYRRHVDARMSELLEANHDAQLQRVAELGIQHEQQHQELILTDVKHALSCNPLYPAYHDAAARPSQASLLEWLDFDEGLYWIGHGGDGFAFDNETPRHREFLEGFAIADRPVNCGEYLEFIDDGGYRRPELWLAAGWQTVRDEGWQAPLYWEKRDGRWWQFTLSGLRPVEPAEPVCHVSYFEADAFARWAGARLPTEAEWETAAAQAAQRTGNFADTLLRAGAALHPSAQPQIPQRTLRMFGDVWQWTASPYTPYPGYQAPDGALGEYNGKFMCNQYVLRGGSCATSQSHIRATYRNFFPPEARWQFSGIRLAR